MCTTVCTIERRPPILRKSPLVSVAAELRFPEAVLLPQDLKTIRKQLGKEYPISDTEHGLGFEFSVQGLRQQQTLQRHVYRTRDGRCVIGLTSTTLVLEVLGGPDYHGFESFLDQWLTALNVVVGVAEVDTQVRLGLRYINQVGVDDVSVGLDAVADRINPALLSPYRADGFEFAIATSFEELRLAQGDRRATLRHGFQAVPDPSTRAPGEGVYTLDIDVYDDEVKDFDRDGHVEELTDFNFKAWTIFRWSLTDAEYQRMEPEERS